MEFEFEAQLWLWEARRTERWTFVSVPEAVADEVVEVVEPVTRGFGSVRVEVHLGSSTWRTSLFPGQNTYVLPIKKAVRTAQGCDVGDTVRLRITLLDV